jgi:hypothetical protein
MQSKEFDNLMAGKDAKWADFGEIKNLKKVALVGIPDLRKEIQNHEKSIPKATRENIDALIAKLRGYGMKETKVRRIVKNTFRITVV